ncbi:hypothetical protein PTTG_29211 [Puccinia triticina 1-1 BBBD Race 1]|uniref:Uncharacterized protein n=1 Tax=Puccinia triticina (isolate 1-1 / race 1 (BBBD)) TaxID=630390 RepID=A0A180G664_PUCT1|nr:hypothetical protein PTTG_29211 [Puccinia triticina 1-1 BBBD Race 1]
MPGLPNSHQLLQHNQHNESDSANQGIPDTAARTCTLTMDQQKKIIVTSIFLIAIGIIFSRYYVFLGPDHLAHKCDHNSSQVFYSPPKPLFKNRTCPEEEKRHCDFIDAIIKIEVDEVNISILEGVDKFRARLDLADSETGSELDSQNLGELWQTMSQELHLLIHHSRFASIKGRMEMQLLFEEYYAFNQANLASMIDSPTLMLVNLIRILNSLLEMSDQISRVTAEASKINAQVRRLLYVKGKKLTNTINQSGIFQHGLRFIFGDTWIRQRKFELFLVNEGIELSQAVSAMLTRFESTFKLYHNAGKLLLEGQPLKLQASIDRVMQEHQPTKTIRSLVLLFSIFKCNQGENVLFQYSEIVSPAMSIDS